MKRFSFFLAVMSLGLPLVAVAQNSIVCGFSPAGGGTQCEEMSTSACIAQHGTVYDTAAQCWSGEAKVICGFTLPGGGSQCEETIASKCADQNGTAFASSTECWNGITTVICGFAPPGGGWQCEEMTRDACARQNGIANASNEQCWKNNRNTSSVIRDVNDHTCYIKQDGACAYLKGTECTSRGGIEYATNEECGEALVTLEQGYCCVPNEPAYPQCQNVVTRSECTSRGGTLSEFKNTGACATCRISSTPKNSGFIPPAGYEDEVLTNFDAYRNPFPDTDMTQLSGKAAAELYRRAVIGGFPDGQFKGDRAVNRAEAAKFLILASKKKWDFLPELYNNGKFPDVLDGQWYTKFVIAAANKGIINGNPDGTFRPANQVNTAEFLKMLTLTFGLQLDLPYDYRDVSSDDWFAPYTGIAQKYNLFPGRSAYLSPEHSLTREEVAVAIYQYLSQR